MVPSVLFVLPGVFGFAARSWLAGRYEAHLNEARDEASFRPLELGLLPFSLDDALLPGETKQVHLFEARFIQLFAEAAGKHENCLGALLVSPRGHAASVTTLLEVEEYRKEEFGVWANLKVEIIDWNERSARTALLDPRAWLSDALHISSARRLAVCWPSATARGSSN